MRTCTAAGSDATASQSLSHAYTCTHMHTQTTLGWRPHVVKSRGRGMQIFCWWEREGVGGKETTLHQSPPCILPSHTHGQTRKFCAWLHHGALFALGRGEGGPGGRAFGAHAFLGKWVGVRVLASEPYIIPLQTDGKTPGSLDQQARRKLTIGSLQPCHSVDDGNDEMELW